MRHGFLGVAGLALFASLMLGGRCSDGCPSDFQPVVLPEFLFGLSQVPADAIPIAQEVGAKYLRPTLSWRVVEPTVTQQGLTLEAVRSDPTLVSQWSASRDWSAFDQRLGAIDAAGLVAIAIIAYGDTATLPLLGGQPAALDVLGREEYPARRSLFTAPW